MRLLRHLALMLQRLLMKIGHVLRRLPVALGTRLLIVINDI